MDFKKSFMGILLFIVFNTSLFALGKHPCIDPFSTIDWGFFFDEFEIGTYGYGGKSPFCQCVVNKEEGQPDVGIKMRIADMVGFTEVTDTPFYFPCWEKNRPNKVAIKKRSSEVSTVSNGSYNETGTYMNAHFITFPVFAVLNLFTNQACLSAGKIDLPFIGELEPEWYNEFIASYMHPENMLVSNPIAQIACLQDCVSSSFKKPNEALIWCRGCWHTQRAEDGRVSGKIGILDAAELSTDVLDWMAMSYRSPQTIPVTELPAGVKFTPASPNAIACGKRVYFPRIIKPAFFLQPAYPTANSPIPIGYPPLVWTNFKTVPGYTSHVFAVWQRRICCFGIAHALHWESAN